MITDRERDQYRRQLPLLGEEGQERIRETRLCIGGAGGLGCAIALHCAFAGFGRITLIDDDVVKVHNLNRQVLYREEDIGRLKVEAAKYRLDGISPILRVDGISDRITAESVDARISSHDIVLDALDNYEARFLLHDACQRAGIPFIHGAIHGFYGQVSTILPRRSTCLHCLVPRPLSGGAVPILAMTAGVVGAIQSTEALKIAAGTGILLAGRLLLWDGRAGEAEVIEVRNNPDCPWCGGDGHQD
jgi:adenylyltransferase/sulfurtransferase